MEAHPFNQVKSIAPAVGADFPALSEVWHNTLRVERIVLHEIIVTRGRDVLGEIRAVLVHIEVRRVPTDPHRQHAASAGGISGLLRPYLLWPRDSACHGTGCEAQARPGSHVQKLPPRDRPTPLAIR